MGRGYSRRHKKCAPNNESDVSKTTAKTEVFRHLEPGDIVEISGNTRPIIDTFPHTTLRKAHGSHCAGNHIKVDEKRRYHISNLSQVVKPSYDRPRPNLQGQRHHLQAYRTRETNANRWAWKEFEMSLKNKYWGYICRDTYVYRYVYIVLTIFPQDINEQRLSAQWTKNRRGSISRRPPRLIFRRQVPYESCTSRRQDDYQVHF